MLNPNYEKITDFSDVESHNAYQMLQASGMSEHQALKMIQEKSRDNSRSPMQWDASENAGFTTGTPWLKVGKQYQEINVHQIYQQQDSVFSFYQKLITLRKEYSVISEGDYQPYLMEHDAIFAYKRVNQTEEVVVWNNFYEQELAITIPDEFVAEGNVLISNINAQKITKEYVLSPYETLALYREK